MENEKIIFNALIQLQAELKPIPRNAENPFFKSSYADLPALRSATQALLKKHGLALIHKFGGTPDDVCVSTVLIHESGESLDLGTIHMKPTKSDPQGVGSCLSYGKRYGFGCIGVVQEGEDDDANAATQPKTEERKKEWGKPYGEKFKENPPDTFWGPFKNKEGKQKMGVKEGDRLHAELLLALGFAEWPKGSMKWYADFTEKLKKQVEEALNESGDIPF